MVDFRAPYLLARGRFDEAVLALNAAQLNFRLVPNSLTIGESALHVVAAELGFLSGLLGQDLNEEESRIVRCLKDGVMNDAPFPFSADEITPELVRHVLGLTRDRVISTMAAPPDGFEERTVVSAFGPVINGEGAMARLAFHPAYHHGQAYLILSSPDFPK